MQINEAALRQILQAYGPQGQGTAKTRRTDDSGSSSQRGDEITISSQGQELQRMIRSAQQADDVRAARVQELQTQLRTGSYNLDANQIAQNMLGLADGDANS